VFCTACDALTRFVVHDQADSGQIPRWSGESLGFASRRDGTLPKRSAPQIPRPISNLLSTAVHDSVSGPPRWNDVECSDLIWLLGIAGWSNNDRTLVVSRHGRQYRQNWQRRWSVGRSLRNFANARVHSVFSRIPRQNSRAPSTPAALSNYAFFDRVGRLPAGCGPSRC